MKMTLSEVFDVVSKDLQEVLVQTTTGASVGKMLDHHIAPLRAIKKKIKKKKKLFPTDRPCLEKGIYGQANYFFFIGLTEMYISNFMSYYKFH